jgi:biopolymer transport protein ExbD
MPTDRQHYDIWVRAIDRVYPQIPFTLLSNWIQEGRVLPDDKVRPAGTSDWTELRQEPLLAAYLPKPAAIRADDQAEALEPVELGFGPKIGGTEEEEDPDMIPLIDISLVLLVFFMMTAGEMISASIVETPPAENARVIEPGKMTVSIALADGNARYFFGDEAADALSEEEVLARVADHVQGGGTPEAIIKANAWVPYETVQKLLMGLEKLGVQRIEAGVRDARRGEQAP